MRCTQLNMRSHSRFCMPTDTCTRTCKCAYTYISHAHAFAVHVHVHTHIQIHIQIHIHIHLHKHIHTRSCTHTNTHTHAHTHTHTFTFPRTRTLYPIAAANTRRGPLDGQRGGGDPTRLQFDDDISVDRKGLTRVVERALSDLTRLGLVSKHLHTWAPVCIICICIYIYMLVHLINSFLHCTQIYIYTYIYTYTNICVYTYQNTHTNIYIHHHPGWWRGRHVISLNLVWCRNIFNHGFPYALYIYEYVYM